MDQSEQMLIKGYLRNAISTLRENATWGETGELNARAEELEEIANQELYTKRDVIELLKPIVEANDDIQELVSTNHFNGTSVLLKALSDLDWTIRNVGVKNE